MDTVWCIKCSLIQHLCEEMFALFFTNECLWWSVFFQICQQEGGRGGRDTKKKQISGFYERKKEEVLTRREGDEKKRKNLQKQTNLPKIRSPSLLSWRERVCVCARV